MSLGSEGHGLEAPLTLGCLMKWLNSIRGYHERFFVLDRARGTLVYHKCRGEFKHQLPLALADISSTQVGATLLSTPTGSPRPPPSLCRVWFSSNLQPPASSSPLAPWKPRSATTCTHRSQGVVQPRVELPATG
jgi:hypothetical protein